MQSIREIALKIKAGSRSTLFIVVGEWGLFILIILAIMGSFGLGRLSVLMAPNGPILSQNAASAASTAGERGVAPGGTYVASKTGQVYYFPWCAGVERISPETRRWFATETAAQKAGYRPAKNCKGLVSE